MARGKRREGAGIGALRTLLQLEFLHASLVRGDGRALDANRVLLDGLGSVQCDLVVGLVAVLEPQVIVLKVDVEVGVDEAVLDVLPDDARHLVAVKLHERVLDLDLAPGGGHGAGARRLRLESAEMGGGSGGAAREAGGGGGTEEEGWRVAAAGEEPRGSVHDDGRAWGREREARNAADQERVVRPGWLLGQIEAQASLCKMFGDAERPRTKVKEHEVPWCVILQLAHSYPHQPKGGKISTVRIAEKLGT